MSKPQILQQSLEKPGLFVQFGGQGAPWYKELKKYYDSGEMKPFFDAALSAIEEEFSIINGTPGVPHGLDARKWLDDESSIPSEEYLGCAAVSIPMIQMTQLAHLEALTQAGYDRPSLVQATVGGTGHSQGLIPSTLVSLGLEGNDYLEAVKKYTKYVLYIGIRSQEVFPFFDATAEEAKQAEELGAANPAPMVAVLGEDHAFIEDLVAKENSKLDDDKRIYVSLYNSPNNRILSSHRSSLIQFHAANKAAFDEKKVKFVYLRTTCPFHSPLMEPMMPLFEKDLERIGFDYQGSQLKFPIYSFFDQRNYQTEADMPRGLATDMVLRTLYWDKPMKAAAEHSPAVSNIVDFGPGKTSQRLSMDSLKGIGKELPVLAVAFAKDFKQLTE
ncbi:MAG: ACP S-malonyltransferase [Leptospiraceae bacterium]|nr:ACP S-malonyltransferase [Leptospiraceae bacterium]MCB1303548.1 ACP S-malonyltransferase [Leptospiraceae bacterium]